MGWCTDSPHRSSNGSFSLSLLCQFPNLSSDGCTLSLLLSTTQALWFSWSMSLAHMPILQWQYWGLAAQHFSSFPCLLASVSSPTGVSYNGYTWACYISIHSGWSLRHYLQCTSLFSVVLKSPFLWVLLPPTQCGYSLKYGSSHLPLGSISK